MTLEPRQRDDYSGRQIEAARRVLVDLGQVLAAYADSLVVVGGWVPDLMIEAPEEPHIGSIDVDLALDASKLGDGRYAALVDTLIQTRRYHQAEESFRLYAEVDLADGEGEIRVDVDFLKSPIAGTKRNKPKLMRGFRPLDASGCGTAFVQPELVEIEGQMITGVNNRVELRVASIPDFLIMKAYALAGRDKPKDAYDLCFCLDHFAPGIKALAENWKLRAEEKDVIEATKILRQKFVSVDSYGPGQVAEFLQAANRLEKQQLARRAFEVVQAFLNLLV